MKEVWRRRCRMGRYSDEGAVRRKGVLTRRAGGRRSVILTPWGQATEPCERRAVCSLLTAQLALKGRVHVQA